MRVFFCKNCRSVVYFHNIVCINCGKALGFDPASLDMNVLEPDRDGAIRVAGKRSLKYCANYTHGICNWLAVEQAEHGLCLSCSRNRTIPDLSVSGNVELWFEIEKAKRQLIYSLLMLRLPLWPANGATNIPPLTFDILADAKTGHQDGVITINLAEADPARREQTRLEMNEEYRTLLGHFRHESGHYYWMLLAVDSTWLERFRQMFGDEQTDYQAALAAYHARGRAAGWQQDYISDYATAHPWEDWAETWANYLHVVDTMEMARTYRLGLTSPGEKRKWFPTHSCADPYKCGSAKELVKQWLPIALAMNSMNHCMGLNDFYPFEISPHAAEKLDFVHQTVKALAAKP